MVVKSFHLLGRDPSVTHNLHMIEIDITHDLDAAKVHVADSFSIVDPAGIAFQSASSQSLPDIDALLDADQPIAVTVDGHAVREVPSPQGLPVVGNYYQVYPDHIGNHQRMFERLGPVIKHTEMGSTKYLTNDPAVAAQSLQESAFWSKLIEGDHPLLSAKDNEFGLFLCDTDTEAWRQTHKFIPQALSPKAVRHYAPMTQRTAEETFKVFDHFSDNNEAFDVFAYMFKLTSQAVAKLILDTDLHHFDSSDAPLGSFVADTLGLLALIKQVSEKGAWYSHLPFGTPQKLRTLKASFAATIKAAMKKAQEQGGEDLPIATAALEARSIADFAARAVDENGNKLSEDHVAGAMPILIGAGFTTTAALMSWMVYSATMNPGVQDKILQELVNTGGASDKEWDTDATNELPYLDKFIKETQRLYNPAFQPARTALRDQIIAGGFAIPKGATMISSLHAIHRNPAVWEDPQRFNPDRWDTEKVRKRPAGSFIPFAMGPRSCIGFNFALQEAKTMFATLIYRYEFIKHGDEPVDYDHDLTLYRPSNFYAQIRRRTSWPEKSK